MSKRLPNPAALTSTQGLRVPQSKSALYNRKCVVVGQKMLKTEPSDDVEVEKDVGLSDASFQSVDDSHSPATSTRSSNSSMLGNIHSDVEGSVSDRGSKLLDELKYDIEANAAQLMKLTSEIEEIPTLKKKIEEIEKEKKLMSENLFEKCEIVETMKQRLSVLHEQNSQLAQLTKHSTDSSDTTLRMRNALVASLAQIKKLQEKVDEVPRLKAEISTLMQENSVLKEQEQDVLKKLLICLPKGTTALDYYSLLKENKQLKASGENLSNKIIQLLKSIEVLSDSIEDMRRRAESFEKSLSISDPLTNRIKELEKEREDLYDEIVHLKLNKSIDQGIDTIYLNNECTVLRKTNATLQSKLDRQALQHRNQKEKMILKLFEIEVSSVESRKFEIEKQLSDICSSTDTAKTRRSGEEDSCGGLSPQFKAQIMKLHQCQLQSEQFNHMMQLVVSENADLERQLTEINKKLVEKSVTELECKVKEYESKLALAHAKITNLEKQLLVYSQAGDSPMNMSTARDESHDSETAIIVLKKQLSVEQQSHEVDIQKCKKLKEQRQKLDTKLKESKHRYQALAAELSSSIQLVKNYQVQCVKFEKEIEIVSAERENFRKEVSSLKAELEVLKAEYTHNSNSDNIPSSGEDKDLQQNEELQRTVEAKTQELKTMKDEYDHVCANLCEAEQQISLQQKKNTVASEESSFRIQQLEAELNSLSAEHQTALACKESLQHKIQELSDEILLLSTRLTEVTRSYEQLKADHDNNTSLQSLLKKSEIEVSHLQVQIRQYKSSSTELMDMIATKEKKLKDISSLVETREAEIKSLKENIQKLEISISQDSINSSQLYDEIEGYKAMIKSLERQIDEAETREIEHELLKQRIKRLERSLGDSKHDNKAIIELLHEIVKEIPSVTNVEQSLQDHNLQLEEQISVLSQWNDTQRHEIVDLERRLDESSNTCKKLLTEIKIKEDLSEENFQLKRELKEVEIEVNALRRQVRADMKEELQMKLEAQTQLLAVFNQHNNLLQQQVRNFFV